MIIEVVFHFFFGVSLQPEVDIRELIFDESLLRLWRTGAF